ncbi:MAG: type II/IV secretion system protein [Nitrospira sp.]|nr:type II/IV secretion system protein [Nitrospira sp.]
MKTNTVADTTTSNPVAVQPGDFVRFKEFLARKLALSAEQQAAVAKTIPAKLYTLLPQLNLSEDRLAQYIAEFLQLTYLPSINPATVRTGVLPASFCRQNQVAIISDASGSNALVLSNPFNLELQDTLTRCTNLAYPPKLVIAETATIMAVSAPDDNGTQPSTAINGKSDYDFFVVDDDESGKVELESTEEGAAEEYQILSAEQMSKMAKLPPIIRLVNTILSEAVKARASDIHIEPQENILLIRYRIDGSLVDHMRIPKNLQPNIISRLKIIARMDIAERRKPQDGRSRLKLEDRRIDLRVSTLPAQFGEKIVIRLLDNSTVRINMNQLGLVPDILTRYQRLLSSPQGMILVTGPTGSGKTSTLYASLNWLKSPSKNIITVEDPIEFQVPGLTQVQIDTKNGTSFAAGLRSILRQDPNIILVGEIRDAETASIALEAAQTGHLLLSTLHTNDAVATITRLLDLGVEPFQVASAVIGILAQRLVRRLCPHCAVDGRPSEDAIEKAGGHTRMPSDATWKTSVGCEACQQTGFKGRMAIHEFVEITPEIRDLIAQRAPDHAIREIARNSGMQGLMQAGIAGAAQGLTTLEEVLKVAPKEPDPIAVPLTVASTAPAGLRNAAPGIAPPPASDARRKIAILILEDETDTRDLLKMILEKQGYDITLAGDGIEGLLHMGKRTFDLILSDINMPNLSGTKLLEINRQKGIATPVIFLTGESGEESEQQCLELGAVDYIKKPFKKEVLILRVERACRQLTKP